MLCKIGIHKEHAAIDGTPDFPTHQCIDSCTGPGAYDALRDCKQTDRPRAKRFGNIKKNSGKCPGNFWAISEVIPLSVVTVNW